MGRELKRVPLNFDYPIGKTWYGYYCTPSFCHREYSAGCDGCKEFARIKGVPMVSYGCPDFENYFTIQPTIEPPNGDGYQLWETTSEGGPISPVFETLDQLCEWAAENATTFANCKVTKEQWGKMLDANFVHHVQGNIMFI